MNDAMPVADLKMPPYGDSNAMKRIDQLETAMREIRDRAATMENGGAWAAGLASLALLPKR